MRLCVGVGDGGGGEWKLTSPLRPEFYSIMAKNTDRMEKKLTKVSSPTLASFPPGYGSLPI